jgi:hypothetical protein
MAWPPTAEDRQNAFNEDGTWFLNRYRCDCTAKWTDQWACMCDNDCPACGTTCSPYESKEIAFDG